MNKEETFTGRHGTKIFMRSWRPAAPKAVVVICHGVNSHSGQYLWTGEQLSAAGFAVYAYDHRGRGKSEGPRFYIDEVADYTEDLGTLINLVKTREPGLKVFLLGHSAGGVVGCTWALDHQKEIAGIHLREFRVQGAGARTGARAGAVVRQDRAEAAGAQAQDEGFHARSGGVGGAGGGSAVQRRNSAGTHRGRAAHATDRMKAEFNTLKLPLLIMHGTLDKATVPAGSKEFYEAAGASDKTLKLYEGHFHDLLNDLGKDKVLADVVGWITARNA